MLEARPAVSFQRSQVQDPAGLVTMGPQPLLLAARRVWLGTRKPSCHVSSRASSYLTSLPWTCIAPNSCHIPRGGRPLRVPVLWYGGLSSPPHTFRFLCVNQRV